MTEKKYIMESDEESHRLDIKIDESVIKRQARWAGIKPGMRVADLGCGPGKISFILYGLVQPGGSVVGVDGSASRLDYARRRYGIDGIEYLEKNIAEPLDDLGEFDFIWVRFVLEYFRVNGFEIVKNFCRCLKPGGTVCFLDLDHNPVNYYGTSDRLDRTFKRIMQELEERFNFDPYVGRKLYSFLYDLGYENIDVSVENHTVFFDTIDDVDSFNMMKKIEVISKKIDFDFEEYEGGYDEFYREAESFFSDPRRFAYTPLIIGKGRKPAG